ncbi:MAG: peptidase M14 [Bryobacteraceae bacterium]|nr:peptidase M14 [Bryobacteraceae bacterium]
MRCLLTFTLLAVTAAAQTRWEYWPGVQYDPAIPTTQKVLGHAPGDRIASHASLMKYFEALAAAAPNRVRVFEYAKSWEGKKLIYAAIGSEANIRRMAELKAGMQRLADPRKTGAAEAQKLMAGMPAIVWLGYGVHGNEISSPDAAMQTAYHLVAARGDATVDQILANVVVLIDPTQNPDGRDRFVHHFEIAEGLEPDPDQAAAEHNENWPGGRTNHYYFDLNRDWLTATQPESQGRIRMLQEWYPLVCVDLHEMGTDSTYYFAPDAVPFNPHLTREQKQNQNWFGETNAKLFDRFGYSYFTREVYDAFYPGYGASWPSYYGAIAMTYENGSTRGLIVKKSDGSTITFRETVRRHFLTSIGTLDTAARKRAELLNEFYKYRATAVEEGQRDAIKEYILPRRGDVSAVDKLALVLAGHGVEVKKAAAAFSNGGKEYPAGSYVIPLAQPAKRLIRTLLDANVAMDEAFLTAEERRRRRRLGSEIYDVTAWSLPLQYNVECASAAAASAGNFEMVKPGAAPAGKLNGGPAQVAYLVPWGSQAAGRFLAGALKADLRVLSSNRNLKIGGREYPAGTLVIKVLDNAATVHETVSKLAESSGAEVFAAASSWTEEGITFGSRHVVNVKKPRIVLVWDQPTSSNSAGHTRFVLERQFGYPVTVIRAQRLAGANLTGYDVIIMPDGGGYQQVFGNGQRLREWVQAGGTLVTIGGGTDFAISANMLSTQAENLAKPGQTSPPARTGATAPGAPGAAPAPAPQNAPGTVLATEADLEKAITPDTDSPLSLRGAIARANTDQEHWLAAGTAPSVNVVVAGSRIYAPLKANAGVNVASFAGPDQVLASGYMTEEYRKQLAFKPFVMIQRQGRGNVIAFTADPNYRAYLDGLNVLFLNAVFRGPANAGGGFGAEEEEHDRH